MLQKCKAGVGVLFCGLFFFWFGVFIVVVLNGFHFIRTLLAEKLEDLRTLTVDVLNKG